MKRLGHTPPGSPATALIKVDEPLMQYNGFKLPRMYDEKWYRWMRAYSNHIFDCQAMFSVPTFDLAPKYRPLTITEHSV